MKELWPRQIQTDIRTHACMHTRTHAHIPKQNSNSYVSFYCKAGSTKRNNIHVYILEQTPKSDYICIQFMLVALIISSVILLVNIIVMSSNTSISMLTLLHQIKLEV